MLVKAYTDKAFRELALCKSTLVASERSDFKILFLHSIYSIDDRFITYLLFPFYDNHRSKPFLAVIPWKSPEDRLNLSSEDKPDDQVKPLTPLTHPPPQKKKIQDVILVTRQNYILNAQGAYNHSAGGTEKENEKIFPAVHFPIC